MTYALGIDLGTTFSAAALTEDGRTEIFDLGNRSPSIPSVVVLREDGEVLVGEAADRRSQTEPLRTAREFKRRLGDPTPILLGGTPYSAEALMARLLRAIVDQVVERKGEAPSSIVVSHPANYGPYKLDLMEQAVRQAEIGSVGFITEPMAAALHYTERERIDPGQVVAVYDFGGGTFDAALLRRTQDSFEQLGEPEGLERLGGIDFDEAVFAHVMSTLGSQINDLDPDDPATVAAVSRLRDQCRDAKEALSEDTDVTIPVALPGIQTDIRLTRAEFEEMIAPRIGETVAALQRAVRSAGLQMSDLDKILLVGGTSRIPLVRQKVREATGAEVVVDAHPKHAISLGAAAAAARQLSGITMISVAAPPTIQTREDRRAGSHGAWGAAAAGAAGAAAMGAAGQAATPTSTPQSTPPPTPPPMDQATVFDPGPARPATPAPTPPPTPAPGATPPPTPYPGATPPPTPYQGQSGAETGAAGMGAAAGMAAGQTPTPPPGYSSQETVMDTPAVSGPPGTPPPTPPAGQVGDYEDRPFPIIPAAIAAGVIVLLVTSVSAFLVLNAIAGDDGDDNPNVAAAVVETETAAANETATAQAEASQQAAVSPTSEAATETATTPATESATPTDAPTETAAAAPTATEAAAATDTPEQPAVTETPDPCAPIPAGRPAALITNITEENNDWKIEFVTCNISILPPAGIDDPNVESYARVHTHFFYNPTVPQEEAGVPGAGPWTLYGGPSPYLPGQVNPGASISFDARPADATRICVLIANIDHSVRPDTGNCFDLP